VRSVYSIHPRITILETVRLLNKNQVLLQTIF